MTPYPTAQRPGAQPVSLQEFNASRKRAQAALLPQCESLHCSSSRRLLRCGSTRTRRAKLRQSSGRVYQSESPLPIEMLCLTTRLAYSVFLGGCALPFAFLLPAACISSLRLILITLRDFSEHVETHVSCVGMLRVVLNGSFDSPGHTLTGMEIDLRAISAGKGPLPDQNSPCPHGRPCDCCSEQALC